MERKIVVYMCQLTLLVVNIPSSFSAQLHIDTSVILQNAFSRNIVLDGFACNQRVAIQFTRVQTDVGQSFNVSATTIYAEMRIVTSQ